MTDFMASLEGAAARDVGRGTGRLLTRSAGGLAAAAPSLVSSPAPKVVVVTGFYISTATPAAAETDGPVGAVQLAVALRALGAAVRIVTDLPCAPVVSAALAASTDRVPLDVAPVPATGGADGFRTWEEDIRERYAGVTHMIAVERAGPSEDGNPRDMRGADITAHTAPLDRLFAGGPWFTIGIGDGGNELGMGSLSRAAVAAAVPNGGRIRCTVPCDALIVAGTSNWGAAALVAALSYLAGLPRLAELLTPAWSRAMLCALRRAGAVDGVLRRPADGVDGLSWPHYIRQVDTIRRLLSAETEAPTRARRTHGPH